MKEKAVSILNESGLTPEEKVLWTRVIEANDESFAERFIDQVGSDNETLKIATELIVARSKSDVPVKPGMVTKKEEKIIMRGLRN